MKLSFLLAASMLVLAPVAITTYASTRAEAAIAQTETRSVTFLVENMTCALCPVTVRRAMESVDGVRSVEIDFEARTATVIFDPQIATSVQIAAASANAGYPANLRS